MGGTAVAERAWCVVVPHHARGARLARHRLAGELTPVVGPELLADAVAVVAELVGNAIRHAQALPGDVIRVAWRIRTGGGRQQLEVRVTDGGAGDAPRQRDAGVDSIDGRGLAIVSALAERWGVDCDGLGQSVWAQLSQPVVVPTAPASVPSENSQSVAG
ncbi:MAG: ATP-binding protein [Actinobacteria bacterium 13_2_20CM_2_71_6]|nr:MAG: ATP-binding protein [Actinobacteria bacterium 13_2_20CM_2_71_6]